ncbi:MAG: NFACT family protein [Vampirovibrionales bacterium]
MPHATQPPPTNCLEEGRLPQGWQPDALAIHHLARSLQGVLAGAKIQKIQHRSHREWVLTLWSPAENNVLKQTPHLYISVDKQWPACCLWSTQTIQERVPQAFEKPTNDCMLLRKHLLHGRITHVQSSPGERLVIITIENTNAMGHCVVWEWVIELMGRYSAWWLVEKDTQQIMGSAHRITEHMSDRRPLMVGEPYRLPPPPGEKPWLGTMPWQTLAKLFNTTHPQKLANSLLSVGYGISQPHLTLLLKVLLKNHNLSAQEMANTLQATLQGQHPWHLQFNSPILFLQQPSHQNNTVPVLGSEWRDSLSQYWAYAIQQHRCQQLRDTAIQALHREQDRLIQRTHTQQPTLTCEAITQLDCYGHALITHGSQVGMHQMAHHSSLILPHPHTNQPFTVPLQPHRTWQENALTAYQQAKKARQKEQHWQKIQHELNQRQERLTHLLWQASNLETPAEGWAFLDELSLLGLTKKPSLKTTHSQHPVTGLSQWINPEGVILWLGKQGLANATLLAKQAHPTHCWCHVKLGPGAHVLIQTPWETCSSETLLDGLTLAALYSPAGQALRESAISANFNLTTPPFKLDVIVTPYRFVRGVPRSYPGHVTYKNEETYHIAVDIQRLEQRLKPI